MRELVEITGGMQPSAWLSDTSQQRRCTGSVDPVTLSFVAAVNDQWYSSQPIGAPPPPPPAGRGALAIGTSTYTVPTTNVVFVSPTGIDSAAGTQIAPFASLSQGLTALSATGGTVIMRAGIYHESFTIPAGRVATSIQSYPNEAVWFDGSTITSGWTLSGSVWTHTGIVTQFYRYSSGVGWSINASGGVNASFTTDLHADKSDMVFLDGVQLHQIADAATPGVGQFSVNYAANTITIGSNPAGHEIRVTDLRYLFSASSPVSMYGIGLRRFGSDYTNAITSPVYYGGSSDSCVFENVVASDNACSGLSGLNRHNFVINQSTIQNNCYTGIGATTCDGIQITGNIVQNNNGGLFQPAPQAGNIKITSFIGCLIDNNYINNAYGGNGIWLDSSNVLPVITNNYVTGNHKNCIQYEETDGGYIAGVQNRGIIAGNILNGGSWGISFLVSGNTDVYNNWIYNQTTQYILIQFDRAYVLGQYLPRTEAPWDIFNVWIRNNIFGNGDAVMSSRYFDSFTSPGRSAASFNGQFTNNQWNNIAGGTLVQWGTGQNTYANYSTIASMASAEPVRLVNNVLGPTMAGSAAYPLPANVANALKLTAGTQKIGPLINA